MKSHQTGWDRCPTKWIQRPSEFHFLCIFVVALLFFSCWKACFVFSPLLFSASPYVAFKLYIWIETLNIMEGLGRLALCTASYCVFFLFPHCIPAFMVYSVVYWAHSLCARRPAPSYQLLSSSWIGMECWRAFFFSKPPVAMFLSLLWSPKINQKTSVFVMVEDNQFPMRRREKDRNQKKKERKKLEERKLGKERE